MPIRFVLAMLLGPAATATLADAQTFSITAHVTSAGTAAHAASACFALDAVIAEPVVGTSSGGGFDLSAGFSYAAPAVNDGIFGNGFEDCSS